MEKENKVFKKKMPKKVSTYTLDVDLVGAVEWLSKEYNQPKSQVANKIMDYGLGIVLEDLELNQEDFWEKIETDKEIKKEVGIK